MCPFPEHIAMRKGLAQNRLTMEYISNLLSVPVLCVHKCFQNFSYKLHVAFHISVFHLNSPKLLLIIVANRNFQKVIRRLFRIINSFETRAIKCREAYQKICPLCDRRKRIANQNSILLSEHIGRSHHSCEIKHTSYLSIRS